MTLHSIKDLDAKTASGVLAQAALTANSAFPERTGAQTSRSAELLGEVRQNLRLSPDDNSSEAWSSVWSKLNQELSDVLLKNVDTEKALSRAGQAGRLAPSLYIPEITDHSLHTFRTLGMRRDYFSDAIRRPDDVQHLMTNVPLDREKNCPSLFMKAIISKGTTFWLLVQAHRFGRVQVAQSAWRLYPDEIDLSQAARPVDALRAFVDKFGLTFRIDGAEQLFVEDRKITSKGVKLEWPVGNNFHTYSTVLDHLGIMYCIDFAPYVDYLKRHGVPDVALPAGVKVTSRTTAPGRSPIFA